MIKKLQENIDLQEEGVQLIIKSKDDNLPDDKKLDFDIWLDKKNSLILKVKYKKMGDWEYRLKSFK